MGAPMHRNNPAAFLRQIEPHSTDSHLRLIVLHFNKLFFGVFPSHVVQRACVLCAYLWRPSLIYMLYLHVCEACRSSRSPLPTILLSPPQFLRSLTCLTLTPLPHPLTSN